MGALENDLPRATKLRNAWTHPGAGDHVHELILQHHDLVAAVVVHVADGGRGPDLSARLDRERRLHGPGAGEQEDAVAHAGHDLAVRDGGQRADRHVDAVGVPGVHRPPRERRAVGPEGVDHARGVADRRPRSRRCRRGRPPPPGCPARCPRCRWASPAATSRRDGGPGRCRRSRRRRAPIPSRRRAHRSPAASGRPRPGPWGIPAPGWGSRGRPATRRRSTASRTRRARCAGPHHRDLVGPRGVGRADVGRIECQVVVVVAVHEAQVRRPGHRHDVGRLLEPEIVARPLGAEVDEAGAVGQRQEVVRARVVAQGGDVGRVPGDPRVIRGPHGGSQLGARQGPQRSS